MQQVPVTLVTVVTVITVSVAPLTKAPEKDKSGRAWLMLARGFSQSITVGESVGVYLDWSGSGEWPEPEM